MEEEIKKMWEFDDDIKFLPKEYDYELQIRTGEFEYINLKGHGTIEDAITADTDLRQAHGSDKEGLNVQQWAKVREEYVTTGNISQEDFEALSKSQKWFVHQVKLAKKIK